jgi:hypothetical protein
VRFPRGAPRRAQRGGIHPGAHPQVGKRRREGQRGARRRLPLRDVGHQQRRVAAVGDAAHAVSPGRHVSLERGNDPESERSGHASTPLTWANVACPRHAASVAYRQRFQTPLPPGVHRCPVNWPDALSGRVSSLPRCPPTAPRWHARTWGPVTTGHVRAPITGAPRRRGRELRG